MYAKTLFSALFAASFIALVASPAQANEVDDLQAPAFMSTLTRAAVRAELLSAPAQHQRLLEAWVHTAPAANVGGMALTRAQVVAEAIEAARVGALDRHEYSHAPTAQQLESIRQAGLRAAQMQVASR